MRYIGELRDGEMVSETYLCKTKQSLKTKAGKSYYSLILQDKTGILDAKVWELTGGIDHFEAMEYIRVDGQVVSFQGTLQLNIKRIRRSQEGEYDPSDFVPTTNKNVDEMYGELLKCISKIQQPHLRKLAESFFVEDKEFALRFKKHSAAKSVHHGFVGGLLEHTLGVVKLCEYYSLNYPMINSDLLITAAIFHDIGKLEELSCFPENDYTDDGQLLGHIYIGTEMIGARMRTIPNFPVSLGAQLKHCILAHHGELEYGSPKKPAMIEALALNFADNTDAKLQTMTELLNSVDDKTVWLGLSRLFETNVRRTTI
ncbi:MAG: metal dependent phosphohydrolase [Anaerocolumna sp.]|jgi:3'-5' exoribonuclease|nr:metal dependent phosphohydrolase [Anaerocolumna sp.]